MNILIRVVVNGLDSAFALGRTAFPVFRPSPVSPFTEIALIAINTSNSQYTDPIARSTPLLRSLALDVPDPRSGATPLNLAVFGNEIDRATILLNLGADPDHMARGLRPLHMAAFRGHHLMVELLLHHGAHIDSSGPLNSTPLMSTIMANQLGCAEVLLNAKADVVGVNADGCTPLHLAAQCGNVLAIRLLLDNGADIHSLGQMGVTPLLCAVHAQQLESAKFLLELGAEQRGFQEKRIWEGHTGGQAMAPMKFAAYGLGKNPISREVFAARVMAQSLKFGGTVPFQGGVLELEKGGGPYYSGVMLESLEAFLREYPDRMDSSEISNLQSILYSGHSTFFPAAEETLEEIQKGAVVQLPTGFTGHCIICTIIDDYLVISNKGGVSNRPGEIYKIDRSKLTLEKVREILNRERSAAQYSSWLYSIVLSFSLGVQADDFSRFIEGLYPLDRFQIIDNCSWESVETSVFFTLAVTHFLKNYDPQNPPGATEIKKLQDTFVHWVRFTQLRGMEKYFSHVDCGELPLNRQLATLAFEKMLTIEDWYGMDDSVEKLKERFIRELYVS